jgi:hypothetical protein
MSLTQKLAQVKSLSRYKILLDLHRRLPCYLNAGTGFVFGNRGGDQRQEGREGHSSGNEHEMKWDWVSETENPRRRKIQLGNF